MTKTLLYGAEQLEGWVAAPYMIGGHLRKRFACACCVFECVDRSFVSQEQRGRAAAAASMAGGGVQLLQVGVL